MTQPLTAFNTNTEKAKSQDTDLWDEVRRIFEGFESAAFTKELKAVFENLHDEELLEALEKTRLTGRPGYPIKVMWRTYIASHVLENIHTIQELIRTLRRNPFIAIQCGICSPAEIPTRFAYYRFTKKLIAYTDLIEKCMAKTLETLKGQLPDFMETVCIDSTDIETYVNWCKKPLSDEDAEWGWRRGKDNKDEMYPGYKMHLMVEAKYEVPLMSIVTPANANDSPLMIPVLEKNKAIIRRYTPKFILGDAGYDAIENYRVIVEDFKAIPIIDLNLRRRKGKPDRFEDIANERGTPYCAWGVPMVFWGYDKSQKRLKYRCPQTCGKDGCTWVDKCSKSSYGHVVKIRLKDDYRRFIQVPRHTKRFKQIYNHRTSIERIFSGLKKDGDGKLVNHRIRGLDKITLNCLLSVWVMQAQKCSKYLQNSE